MRQGRLSETYPHSLHERPTLPDSQSDQHLFQIVPAGGENGLILLITRINASIRDVTTSKKCLK